jgi:chemotaxis protein CheX
MKRRLEVRYEYIEPFVNSTVKIFDSVVQCDIAKGNISLVRVDEIGGDVSVVIRLKGDSDGSIILSMNAETAIRVCNVMNTGDFNSITPFGMDSISELANMIAGNAASELNDMGFDFEVSPPLIVNSTDVKSKIHQVEVFQIPLFTECGEVTINVAVRAS